MAKYLILTGGVVSSLGKGITAASIGRLLINRQLTIRMLKLDPYLNVDPGTMSPYQHGEVYVTDDGAETDLDLGHYERYTGQPTSKKSNITAGSVYWNVLHKERRGDYLGGTVQMIPHISNEIKERIRALEADHPDVIVIELGGTVGDIEGLIFLEALRQLGAEVGRDNSMYIHLTYVPYIQAAKEVKTKPTQQSVAKLREIGIMPHILICRTEVDLTAEHLDKLSMFCNVPRECVIVEKDVETSIYEIPLVLAEQGVDELILNHFRIAKPTRSLKEWQKLLSAIEKDRRGPPASAPISIEISGEEFDRLAELAGEIRQRIEPIPGLTDLRSDFENALPELQFEIDRQRAALLGLDTAAVGTFLRTSLYGIESRKKFRAGEDEYDITVRLPKDGRTQFSTLGELRIPVKDQGSVPLSSLGEFNYTAGLGEIKRKDLKRVITLMGNNEGRTVDGILNDVRNAIAGVHLPDNYSIYYAGDNEDSNESMAFLSQAFLLAIAGILVILVIQFNSVLRPFIIGLSIPLSIIGVMWGLILTQTRASVIMTGLGIVSLAGIVVNNAIVLIDCVNLQKKEGMSTLEAVVTAGRLRLRPVLLTAGTTVLGLIPMAAGWSMDLHSFPFKITHGGGTTAWWAPMAIAMIFGLSVATLLTLIYVPVMYSLADSLVEWIKKKIRHP